MEVTRPYRKRPTMFQIQEAIIKNVCAPSDEEEEEFTVSRSIRTSAKREGDSQLGLILFVGLATKYYYTYTDIVHHLTLEREEFIFKLMKYRSKVARKQETRFNTKVRLIENYLKLVHGV